MHKAAFKKYPPFERFVSFCEEIAGSACDAVYGIEASKKKSISPQEQPKGRGRGRGNKQVFSTQEEEEKVPGGAATSRNQQSGGSTYECYYCKSLNLINISHRTQNSVLNLDIWRNSRDMM